MRQVFVIFLMLASLQALASENLTKSDFDGEWKSSYSAIKGEKQILRISLSSASVFERHFNSGTTQTFNANVYELIDDVLIVIFRSLKSPNSYKLALSGWISGSRKTLYGSMFMYRNGIQFNMLPVSFEPK
jgi:hypothetical protein